MNSAEAVKARAGRRGPDHRPRQDVNEEVLASDPMLSFVVEKVLPLTAFRPPLAVYPQVSAALQEATAGGGRRARAAGRGGGDVPEEAWKASSAVQATSSA